MNRESEYLSRYNNNGGAINPALLLDSNSNTNYTQDTIKTLFDAPNPHDLSYLTNNNIDPFVYNARNNYNTQEQTSYNYNISTHNSLGFLPGDNERDMNDTMPMGNYQYATQDDNLSTQFLFNNAPHSQENWDSYQNHGQYNSASVGGESGDGFSRRYHAGSDDYEGQSRLYLSEQLYGEYPQSYHGEVNANYNVPESGEQFSGLVGLPQHFDTTRQSSPPRQTPSSYQFPEETPFQYTHFTPQKSPRSDTSSVTVSPPLFAEAPAFPNTSSTTNVASLSLSQIQTLDGTHEENSQTGSVGDGLCCDLGPFHYHGSSCGSHYPESLQDGAKPPSKPKKSHVKPILKTPKEGGKKRGSPNVVKACTHCKKAHLACDEARPCRRCVRLGKDDCVDVEHKRRGRPKSVHKKEKPQKVIKKLDMSVVDSIMAYPLRQDYVQGTESTVEIAHPLMDTFSVDFHGLSNTTYPTVPLPAEAE